MRKERTRNFKMMYLRYKPFFLAVEKLREQACTREIYPAWACLKDGLDRLGLL